MAKTDERTGRWRIFVSYRRNENDLAIGRLVEDLRRHFTPAQVFQDTRSIAPGADFEEALKEGLNTCAAVVVVITPRWLTVVDQQGRRRLDLPSDWVRREVVASLQDRDVRVFPVLIDAEMPRDEELPEPLRPLAKRQAFPISVRHWTKDVTEFIEYLDQVPGLGRSKTDSGDERNAITPDTAGTRKNVSRVGWKLFAAMGAVILVIAAFVLLGLVQTPLQRASRAAADAASKAAAPAAATATEAPRRAP